MVVNLDGSQPVAIPSLAIPVPPTLPGGGLLSCLVIIMILVGNVKSILDRIC